jgi:outer membrane protein TolC
MRFRLISGWIIVLMLVAAIGYAQNPPAQAPPAAPRLSLADALDLARRNNPAYRQVLNDRWAAARDNRAATLNLLTPNADISASMYASQEGERSFFGQIIRIPGVRQQSYSFGLSYALSGATLSSRGLTGSILNAVDQDIAGAETQLVTSVRSAYLLVLQMRAQEELARRTLERGREGLALAQARHAVGQTTLIDVRREEVARGNAEVGLLRATQNVENTTLALFQVLGVPALAARVEPTDSFPVTEPVWTPDQLVARALQENPGLRALRARASWATWNVRVARSLYLPSLFASAGYGKSRTRVDSTGAEWVPQTNPWSLSIGVQLPLYDGFSRSVATATARASQDDIDHAVRAYELLVRAQVTAAFNTLQAAYRTIAIQEANRTASSEALELATQRYRVGSGSYIELLDARVGAERADADHVSAIYEYHRAIAGLENAVGRPLR